MLTSSLIIISYQVSMLLTCLINDDVSTDHLTEVVFPKFLLRKLTFYFVFPFLHTVFFGSKLLGVTRTKGVAIKFHLIEEVVCTQIMWNSFPQICLFPPFIYSFNGLSVPVWTHRYLFYTLWCDPMLHYLICCMNKLFPFWPWKLFWVGCFPLFDMFLSFYFLSTSLLSGATRFSRFIFTFPATAPDSDIFPRI